MLCSMCSTYAVTAIMDASVIWSTNEDADHDILQQDIDTASLMPSHGVETFAIAIA